MSVIIGIDPGSRYTGYGLIQSIGNQSSYLASGHIPTSETNTGLRLLQIYENLKKIIFAYQPQEAAIEQIFMHQNPGSALKLGQARGAAIVALGLPISEYSARQVKQSVVGYGAAKKEQVQHMVRTILNLKQTLQADEADALAIALCHAHTRQTPFQTQHLKRTRKKSSWRDYSLSD